MSVELVEGLRIAAKNLRQTGADIPIVVPESDPVADLQSFLRAFRSKNDQVIKTLSDLYEVTEYDIEGVDGNDVLFIRDKILRVNELLTEVNSNTKQLQVKLNEVENDRLSPTVSEEEVEEVAQVNSLEEGLRRV